MHLPVITTDTLHDLSQIKETVGTHLLSLVIHKTCQRSKKEKRQIYVIHVLKQHDLFYISITCILSIGHFPSKYVTL